MEEEAEPRELNMNYLLEEEAEYLREIAELEAIRNQRDRELMGELDQGEYEEQRQIATYRDNANTIRKANEDLANYVIEDHPRSCSDEGSKRVKFSVDDSDEPILQFIEFDDEALLERQVEIQIQSEEGVIRKVTEETFKELAGACSSKTCEDVEPKSEAESEFSDETRKLVKQSLEEATQEMRRNDSNFQKDLNIPVISDALSVSANSKSITISQTSSSKLASSSSVVKFSVSSSENTSHSVVDSSTQNISTKPIIDIGVYGENEKVPIRKTPISILSKSPFGAMPSRVDKTSRSESSIKPLSLADSEKNKSEPSIISTTVISTTVVTTSTSSDTKVPSRFLISDSSRSTVYDFTKRITQSEVPSKYYAKSSNTSSESAVSKSETSVLKTEPSILKLKTSHSKPEEKSSKPETSVIPKIKKAVIETGSSKPESGAIPKIKKAAWAENSSLKPEEKISKSEMGAIPKIKKAVTETKISIPKPENKSPKSQANVRKREAISPKSSKQPFEIIPYAKEEKPYKFRIAAHIAQFEKLSAVSLDALKTETIERTKNKRKKQILENLKDQVSKIINKEFDNAEETAWQEREKKAKAAELRSREGARNARQELTRISPHNSFRQKRDSTKLPVITKIFKTTKKNTDDSSEISQSLSKLNVDTSREKAIDVQEDFSKSSSVSNENAYQKLASLKDYLSERKNSKTSRSPTKTKSSQSPDSGSPIKPENRTDVINWYQKIELPKGTGFNADGALKTWFHGLINREQAEKLLKSAPVGSYVVRVSERIWGYAITYKAPEKVKHFLIDVHNGLYAFLGSHLDLHVSLGDLIEYHQTEPITLAGNEILSNPIGQTDPANPDYAELLDFSTLKL